MTYGTWAHVDLDALAHNVRQARALIGGAEILAVLKANAYGHGAGEVFKALKACGVVRFAVATFYEAVELRRLDGEASIMILGYVPEHLLARAADNRFILTVFSAPYWQCIKEAVKVPVTLHVKVNTGFNRIGFDLDDQAMACLEAMAAHPLVRLEGVYSHLALTSEADDRRQAGQLDAFVAAAEARGIDFSIKHLADSIGTVIYPWARMDMVRLGALLYGLKAGYPAYRALDLRPTLKLYSTVSQVRQLKRGEGVSYDYLFTAPEDMPVGTVSFGYADGPARALSDRGHVVINGKKAPIIGLMCMDQTMVDLRGIDAQAGDAALILDLAEESPASVYAMSGLLGTNKNDIIAGIGKRVSRLYTQGEHSWLVNDLDQGGIGL